MREAQHGAIRGGGRPSDGCGPVEAAAQRHLLEAEQAAGGTLEGARDVRRVGVVGAGTMGAGIALTCAQAGFEVELVDAGVEALRAGIARIESTLEAAVKKGRLTAQAASNARARVRSGLKFEALREADLIIEAVFEDAGIKQDVFARLGSIARPGALLATNTSTLDVEAIARASGRPGDVVGMHFFSPAHVMRLIEIVRTPTSSVEALATALATARRLGKLGVVVGNGFGFVGNRMLYAYGRERELMLLEGAEPERIDRVLEAFGMAMGPNAVSDLAGIDVGVAARRQWRERPDDPRWYRVSELLVECGRLGRKSGHGFYRYSGPERRRERDPEVEELISAEARRLGVVRREIVEEEIAERCMLALINEGAHVLDEGIAESGSDIDVIWCNGYGFPRARGGPMFYADTLGLSWVLERIGHYARALDERYWTAAPLLARLASEGGRLAEWRGGAGRGSR
jgi:3-hydroxyacyl-CoA dehydrogenase